jgi:hypothetical protein
MTKDEIKARILNENPLKDYSLNGEIFTMSDEEFNKAVEDRAEMEWQQFLVEQAKAEQRALKVSAYQKLGLSDAEISALLPTE